MNNPEKRRNVLLVGSIPLKDASEVFKTVSRELGSLVARIPDGETGNRTLWVASQIATLQSTPNLEQISIRDSNGLKMPRFGVKDPNARVKFSELGYAREAKLSYREFASMKKAGLINAKTKFQVSLPTALAITASFIDGPSQQLVEAPLEERLLEEVKVICDSIPHHELALQWDVCQEVVILGGRNVFNYLDNDKEHVLEKLIRLGNAVPEDIELGFHLCYGDPGHKHILEPVDLSLSVEISNRLNAGVKRLINWIHMPVPRDRNDDAYFEPLKRLDVNSSTEIFIGLIHLTDGIDGTRKRIATAQKFIPNFGIATECGFGRRPPETVKQLIELHRAVATY